MDTVANNGSEQETQEPGQRSEAELYRYWQNISRECQSSNEEKKPQLTRSESLVRDKQKFATIYSGLVHSGKFTEKLIKLELSYWPAIEEMIQTRDTSVKALETKCSQDIEQAVSQLGHSHTEATISSLSSRYCEDIEKLHSNWNMSIDALQDAQREDFCEKLNVLWKDLKNEEGLQGKFEDSLSSNSSAYEKEYYVADRANEEDLRKLRGDSFLNNPIDLNETTNQIRMEESFTINLGSQLKTAHNIRILAVDPLDLCDTRCNKSPQVRIQTAMSLYSHNLSAVVLLSENYTTSFSGQQNDLLALCLNMNEFHFDDFKQQCNHIRDKVIPAYREHKYLETGDCYITRHSNLASTHIVFHLVSDDSVRKDEVNSRHPIMAGLRNILRVAHIYDIKTISIPLLLLDRMNEEYLTINWCLKRAELVLKCVKGFLIEMASLSTGVEQGTIQFLVPRHISEDLFSSLASLIPEVFRLANSVNLKTT